MKYFCGKCRTVFASDRELYAHLPCGGRHYGGLDALRCPFCGVWFTRYTTLAGHRCEDYITAKEDVCPAPIGVKD